MMEVCKGHNFKKNFVQLRTPDCPHWQFLNFRTWTYSVSIEDDEFSMYCVLFKKLKKSRVNRTDNLALLSNNIFNWFYYVLFLQFCHEPSVLLLTVDNKNIKRTVRYLLVDSFTCSMLIRDLCYSTSTYWKSLEVYCYLAKLLPYGYS